MLLCGPGIPGLAIFTHDLHKLLVLKPLLRHIRCQVEFPHEQDLRECFVLDRRLRLRILFLLGTGMKDQNPLLDLENGSSKELNSMCLLQSLKLRIVSIDLKAAIFCSLKDFVDKLSLLLLSPCGQLECCLPCLLNPIRKGPTQQQLLELIVFAAILPCLINLEGVRHFLQNCFSPRLLLASMLFDLLGSLRYPSLVALGLRDLCVSLGCGTLESFCFGWPLHCCLLLGARVLLVLLGAVWRLLWCGLGLGFALGLGLRLGLGLTLGLGRSWVRCCLTTAFSTIPTLLLKLLRCCYVLL